MRMPALEFLQTRTIGQARRLLGCTRGIAALEFAMVLPIMVLMYLGSTELTFGVSVDRKLTLVSRTLADLTSRTPALNSTLMANIFDASRAVMAPYKSDDVKMVVSSVAVADTGTKKPDGSPILQGKVCWSQAHGTGATAYAKDTVVPLPDGFNTAKTSFIQAEVEMSYRAMFSGAIFKTIMSSDAITLSEKTPWPVRNVAEVTYQGVAACLT